MNKIVIIFHPLGEKKFTTCKHLEEGDDREYQVVDNIELVPGGVLIEFKDEAPGSLEKYTYLNMPLHYNEWAY